MSKMKESYTKAGAEMQRQQDNGPQALVKRHKEFLEARLAHIQKWVTANVRPEALIRFALLDLQQNDKLRACDPATIYAGLLACAVTGLEPGALKGEAYLVPFGGKAQFIVGWKGIVKQARRTREIVGLTSNVVFEGDTFELDLGTENRLRHLPLLRGDRGSIIGSYAIATFATGHREIEWVDREDIDRVRAVADKRGASPAWKDWYDQMARKTSVRRLGKRLPLGHDYYVGMAVEQAQEDGKSDRDVLDIVTDGEASRTEESAERAASMRAQADGDRPPTPEEEAAMDGA
jgi:recombination protein RecT